MALRNNLLTTTCKITKKLEEEFKRISNFSLKTETLRGIRIFTTFSNNGET